MRLIASTAMSRKQHTFDAYLVDTLMRDLVGHDRRPSAFLVYLCLSVAAAERQSRLSHAQLAERTGLSKRTVQEAVSHLIGRKLLNVARDGDTDVPRYEVLSPWQRRTEDRQSGVS